MSALFYEPFDEECFRQKLITILATTERLSHNPNSYVQAHLNTYNLERKIKIHNNTLHLIYIVKILKTGSQLHDNIYTYL